MDRHVRTLYSHVAIRQIGHFDNLFQNFFGQTLRFINKLISKHNRCLPPNNRCNRIANYWDIF